MKKKRIAFVIKNLKMGGTRVSLISLMEAVAETGLFDIDLIVMNQKGPLLKCIPSDVRLLPEDPFLKSAIADKADLGGMSRIVRCGLYFAKKIFGYNRIYKKIYASYARRRIAEPYDLVVGYQEGESNDLSVMIPSRKHLIWYHSNYKTYYPYENGNRLADLFDLADVIAFVTKESYSFFGDQNREYFDKCRVIRNVLPVKRIKALAFAEIEQVYMRNDFRMVSVGRLSPEKGYERAIHIAERLREEGFSFEWVIVGGGYLYEDLTLAVNEKGLTDCLRFVGERRNPYQIVQQADVFVLTSYSEAQPLVILEGLVLGKPFISTDFDSAKETLNQDCGYVVENSEDGLYHCIKAILQDKSMLEEKAKKAAAYSYSNGEVLQALFSLV